MGVVMETLTIGQVARQAGVSVETVRYYERRALLAQPQRPGTGYRQYTVQAVRRILFIKRAQEMGFSLRDVQELLALSGSQRPCASVEREARVVIARIDEKVRELSGIRAALSQLAEACREPGHDDECPLLRALEPEPRCQ
jgi:Hg(II)-responsive transcriptional regulator